MANFKFNRYKGDKNLFVILSVIITLISLLTLLVGVCGYRYEFLSIKFSLLVLTKYGVYASIIATALSLVAFGYSFKISDRFFSIIISVLSFVVNVTIITFFYNNIIALKSNPMINDVSTSYYDIIEYRIYKNHNLPSGEHKLLQKFGGFKMPNYDLSPLLINNKTKDQVFNESLKITISMGLVVTYNNLEEGIIEVVDTSFWYGFKDDMIIRIEQLISDDIIVNVRSASRVGRSDFGVNSRRIIGFFELLNKSLRN